MKTKISFILLAVAVLAVLMSGTALANFGPHGGYVQDTDACAGCHRAHTAFSSVTWTFNGSTKNALLVSSASTMSQFCYACHGDGAPGASTNVQSGIFDAGPSGASGVATGTVVDGTTIIYKTNSSFDATLNGGGFNLIGSTHQKVTSTHQMDAGSATAPMWGNGSAVPTVQALTCTDCHDPHGSSNYRLLKDTLTTPIGTSVVGGYNASGTPNPWVISAETGYPLGGWLKGADGAAQMANYIPNYTSYQYKVNPLQATNDAGSTNSFSGWCSGCHTVYDSKNGSGVTPYNYLGTIGGPVGRTATNYHRHPVETSLIVGKAGNINIAFPTAMLIDPGLPLELSGSSGDPYTDYLTCTTCHYAHGTDATMTGWANGGITTSTVDPLASVPFQDPTYDGVQPIALGSGIPKGSAALLRFDNRGVCERCHNK